MDREPHYLREGRVKVVVYFQYALGDISYKAKTIDIRRHRMRIARHVLIFLLVFSLCSGMVGVTSVEAAKKKVRLHFQSRGKS